MIDNVTATGKLQIVLTDLYGNVKYDETVNNLVVTTGKTFLASRAIGVGSAIMSHMAIGTSNAVAAAGNTTLGTESVRVALTASTVSANEITYTATFPSTGSAAAIVEAGIFNAASAGTMLSRTVFNVVNKEASDSLSITWKLAIN